MDIQIFEYLNNQLKDERKLFLLIFGFNLLFFISGLALGYDVHHFADKADTDGTSYYNIALDPFSSSPEESGFRHATFLYPLITYLIAQGNPFATALTMEMINITAFSFSVVMFSRVVSLDNSRSSILFYAFNPILLISTHGGMNEPLFFTFMFGALYYFRTDNFKMAAIFLAFASLARPDFVIFSFPFFLLAKDRKFLPYLLIPLITISLHGVHLVYRFGLDHFLRFTSGVDSGFPHSMIGIPFQTFFQNRFFGGVNTPAITGLNYYINEFLTWSIFFALILSIYFIYKKKHIDYFSLSLIVFGSVLQPAYSFFSGYFRFASMVPYLYKIPGLTLNNRLRSLFGFLYLIFGISILFAWFF